MKIICTRTYDIRGLFCSQWSWLLDDILATEQVVESGWREKVDKLK